MYKMFITLQTRSAFFAVLLGAAIPALAAAPDLTAGGVPGDTVSFNLGPTGMRGWAYHPGANTSTSRQILVKAVAAGSPADGVIVTNDVILGATGNGATPGYFTSDARKSLGLAIAEAEAQSPAILNMNVWRAGVTNTLQMTLRTMGAYSATAPYNCPKSVKILEEGLQYIMTGTNETAGRYSFGTLSLLAANNPADTNNAARLTRAQTEARALIPSAAVMTQMKSNVRDTASGWERGHTLIVLAEYYLVTGDTNVLPAIEAYAVNVAKNQSMFGTLGHIYAEKNPDGSNNGPMGGVYGPVNSAGLPCFLGLQLASRCGLTNAEIAPAIERTSRFFAYYAGRGSVPYGEHEAYWQAHENNGKSGLSALCFALLTNRVSEQKLSAKMSTASVAEREAGHTGAFFNYVWAPLGAAVGGEETAASFFRRASWYFDLARRWDGGFDYDCLREGPNSGSQYNNFRMSTAMLLTYALPLRQLHLTGRGHDAARWLNSTNVAEAEAADGYSATGRSLSQLVADLGSWSPMVQRRAAEDFANRTLVASNVTQIIALANDTNGTSRVGACLALGKISDSGSAASRAATLAALLTDSKNHVRFMAAEGMRYLPQANKMTNLNTILAAAASTGTPLLPYNEEDPLHFAHARLAMLLFYSGNAYGPKGVIWNTVSGVDRNYLYPAIRAVAANPIGQARSTLSVTYTNLTAADVNALADCIVDSVQFRAPADKMFGGGIRQGGLETLRAKGIAEGVPLCMVYDDNDGRDSVTSDVLGVLQDYGARVTTVVPDSGVVAYLQALLHGSHAAEAQVVLDAIAANPNPPVLTPFKSISTATPDAASLNLPATWTTLRVNSADYAKGNSLYTWRKVYGAGNVTFTPSGTAASTNTLAIFDGTPGQYLFEVKMSDSRGFTEVYKTVAMTLYTANGTLPTNYPPTANPQSLSVSRATPTPVTLTGNDPEGYPLSYTVMNWPTNGTLSGDVPHLLYTSDFNYTGPDGFTFKVTDSDGQISSATINLTVTAATNFPVALYEPFNYPTGALQGAFGGGEVGFNGPWVASSSAKVATGSLDYGSAPSAGNSIGNLNGGSNNYGGSRTNNPAALLGNGLLANGATLWFSARVGYGTNANITNARLGLALANSQFSGGNYDFWIVNEGSQLGSGVGLLMDNNGVHAAQFRDLSAGADIAGMVLGPANGYEYGNGQHGLIVGKITWGATTNDNDIIELFQPETDLVLPAAPISTLAVKVDQSKFDTITWARGDVVVMDEIRFGSSYHSILVGNAPMTPDVAPPSPNPMAFYQPPMASSLSSITMVAASAYDPGEVEYYFTCIGGGGHDSGWQLSRTYTDTGLAPNVAYSYTVTARDRSINQNPTAPSAPASVTITPASVLDYPVWAMKFPAANLYEPNADFDGDGRANDYERIWGLSPTNAAPAGPFVNISNLKAGTFSYTRRSQSLTGLGYTIWTSTNLTSWAQDAGAVQTPAAPVADVETVTVNLTPSLLTSPRLFIRMRAQ